MKKKIFLASLAMLAIVAIIVVSCNENEELDDFYSLDVTSRTPITKSSMADYEPGASQTIGGSTTSPYTVPENEDECMLYAIISIAASRHIPITYRESDGSGGYKKSTKTIGRNGFTATQAYNYVKSMATGQDWTPCDVDGNPIEGAETYNYTGGAMAPSVARSIGEKSGILQGTQMHFNSYNELKTYISTAEFKNNHPSGSYIISSDSGEHAVIGKGVDRKGNIIYSDAKNSRSKFKDSEKTGSWTFIF